MSETKLFIYMLCFDDHMSHARHYIGITADINQRLQTHFDGRGARLTQVLKERGLGFTLARVWVAGERQAEAAIKRQSNAPRFCPICHPGDYQKSFRTLQTVSRTTLIRSGIKINYPRKKEDMAIEFTAVVTCDKCDKSETVEPMEICDGGGAAARVSEDDCHELEGWSINNGNALCDECSDVDDEQ